MNYIYDIYEDKYCKVILNINPVVNGHLLIIPKKHFKDIKDIQIDILTHINKVTVKMIELLEEKLNCEGVTIANNYGCAQEIMHFHIHIIPRYINDGIKHIYPKDKLSDLQKVKNDLLS